MSNQNNFAGGFLLGAVAGGVLGGILGATLVARRNSTVESGTSPLGEGSRDERRDKPRKRILPGLGQQPDFEMTRRGLEDKIAQLNDAIDEARQQLGGPRPDHEEIYAQDPIGFDRTVPLLSEDL